MQSYEHVDYLLITARAADETVVLAHSEMKYRLLEFKDFSSHCKHV